MLEIVRVQTKKQQRDFLNLPRRLYKGNDCYVPPLYGDERAMFKKNYMYYDQCEAAFFNAYRDGVIVGRIAAILQRTSNRIRNEKRVRFNRFDSVNDQEVANALFASAEKWAKEKGMDTVCGPLGFSDLEREGMLIEGFDQLSTFETQYNHPYYPVLVENCGYVKEVDWVERKLYAPDHIDPKLKQLTDFLMKRYELRYGEARNVNDFLNRYGEQFFELISATYADLYQTVPFTEKMKKSIIASFKLIIDLRFVAVILDKEDRVVCFGICFPSIARAVQKSYGRLTPPALIRLLRAIKNPKIIDLGLVGVAPKYANRGISNAIISNVMDMLTIGGIEYVETNCNLEDNYAIQNQWKRFNSVLHKRRRSYIKHI